MTLNKAQLAAKITGVPTKKILKSRERKIMTLKKECRYNRIRPTK